ncbi:extensin [Salmonella bongori]|nr:extensin [Salmonella bongori]
MKGKGFLIIVLLGGISGLGYRYLPSYYNPFAPLQLSDPPGLITTFKLQRLTPAQCQELLTAANQQGIISSQPVADSAGECPLTHVVRVRDFGQVKLSSSFFSLLPVGAELRAVR